MLVPSPSHQTLSAMLSRRWLALVIVAVNVVRSLQCRILACSVETIANYLIGQLVGYYNGTS